MQELFRIKICGVTRSIDIPAIIDAGADAIGLNFYPASSRYVNSKTAEEICRSIVQAQQNCPRKIWKIGVFVNASAEDLVILQDTLKLDGIQLHGDENPEILAELRERMFETGSHDVCLIRAIRCPAGGEPNWYRNRITLINEIDRWIEAGVSGILLDAEGGGSYGGTGQSLDWSRIADVVQIVSVPIVLAGGLRPENVGQAIALSGVQRIDVASGVERTPGVKDWVKVQQFVANSGLISK